jgi:hypothetical protein
VRSVQSLSQSSQLMGPSADSLIPITGNTKNNCILERDGNLDRRDSAANYSSEIRQQSI